VAPLGHEAYLAGMRMFNLRNVDPVGGFGAFIEHWKQPTPYRWQILALSVVLTFTMMVLFMPKTERAPPEKPDIIWINSWPEDRTEKEILDSNLANQKRKEAAAAVEKQRQEFRRQFYRKLARASGFDPDELEREYSRQPAAKPTAQATPAPATAPAAAPAPAKPAGPPAK
jgi:hypothetical protein